MDWLTAGRSAVRRRTLAAMLLGAALATATGCGSGGGTTITRTVAAAPRDAGLTPVMRGRYAYGRGLFNELCAGCHTLRDAGAHGQRFDLDVDSIEGAEVWNAIKNGEPGMPAWGHVLSPREITALATYIIGVSKRRGSGNERWGEQIHRRIVGEQAFWARTATTIEAQLEREKRKGERSSGRVVPPSSR